MFNRIGYYIKKIFIILVYNRGKMLFNVENFFLKDVLSMSRSFLLN